MLTDSKYHSLKGTVLQENYKRERDLKYIPNSPEQFMPIWPFVPGFPHQQQYGIKPGIRRNKECYQDEMPKTFLIVNSTYIMFNYSWSDELLQTIHGFYFTIFSLLLAHQKKVNKNNTTHANQFANDRGLIRFYSQENSPS